MSPQVAVSGATLISRAPEIPSVASDQPYATGDRPMGVMFYRAKESFFLPYSLLQAIRFEQEKLTLSFVSGDVEIEGRGLHQLYVELAAQTVSRIVEQDERYACTSEAPIFIARITEIPKGPQRLVGNDSQG